MLNKKLMAKGKTREASDALCFKLVTILLYADVPFILTGGSVAPTALSVYGPKLRRHLGGRVRAAELQSAFRKLQNWGIIMGLTEGFDAFVFSLNHPRGFVPNVTSPERLEVSLPNIQDCFEPPKRKAKLVEESIKRRLKEKK